MKKHDHLIISLLREDARITLTKMSKKTNIPISTLYERLKAYKTGLIKKNTAIIDFAQLGYNARAKVLLKVKKSEQEDLQQFLMKSKNVNELHKVNNGFDFIAECIFKDMKALEKYVEKVEKRFSIQKAQTFYVIDELKEQEFMSKLSPLGLKAFD